MHSSKGFTNLAKQGEVYQRHGAKVKIRSSERALAYSVIKGGVCVKHGSKERRCSRDGYTNESVKRRTMCSAWGEDEDQVIQ